jgi:hypothetical protein
MILSQHKHLSFLILALLLCCIILACNNITDCGLITNREVKIVFGKRSNKIISDSTTVPVVYVSAIGTNSIFYDSLPASKIGLPLSQLADSSIFILKTDSISNDTIIFKYHRELQMVSSDCGFNTTYTSLAKPIFTTHRIDTIITITNIVSSDIDKNFKIVLRPLHKISAK